MNPVELPSPGLHYGVPFEIYAAWPAINFSKLKPIRKTASKCKWEMDHPKEPTPAMVLGSSLHVATLEPARFDGLFFICPPCDRRTTEGKEAFAKYEKEANGRLLIRSGSKEDESLVTQVTQLRGMAAAIHASKALAPFLAAPGQNEVSMLWRDEETGLMCKGRIDRLIPEFKPLGGIPVVMEIKSTRDAEDWSFGKDCHAMGYAAQAANYISGYKAITGKTPAHIFAAVESNPPHDFKPHMLGDRSLQTGLLQYRHMLNRYAECVAFDHWPGYEDKINVLELPDYANNEIYDT